MDFIGARHCDARAYNMLRLIAADPQFAPQYLDYAQGFNLTNRMPLTVRTAPGRVALNDTMVRGSVGR